MVAIAPVGTNGTIPLATTARTFTTPHKIVVSAPWVMKTTQPASEPAPRSWSAVHMPTMSKVSGLTAHAPAATSGLVLLASTARPSTASLAIVDRAPREGRTTRSATLTVALEETAAIMPSASPETILLAALAHAAPAGMGQSANYVLKTSTETLTALHAWLATPAIPTVRKSAPTTTAPIDRSL